MTPSLTRLEELERRLEAARNDALEEAAALCDWRATSWRETAHNAADDTYRNRAIGMWTGFEAAAQHIRARKRLDTNGETR